MVIIIISIVYALWLNRMKGVLENHHTNEIRATNLDNDMYTNGLCALVICMLDRFDVVSIQHMSLVVTLLHIVSTRIL